MILTREKSWGMNQDANSRRQLIREAGELSIIGLTLVIATVIGYYLGTRVDRYWPQFTPWGTVIGVIVGVVAGFLEMFRIIRRSMRRMERENAGNARSDDSRSHDASS